MRLTMSSDWHGDAYTAGLDRYEDVSDAAMLVAKESIEWKADFHFFLGDLCDPDNVRSHRSIALALKFSALLSENGVTPVWMTGNHDIIEDGSGGHTLMALSEAGFDVIDRPCVQRFGSLNVMALPFTPTCRNYSPEKFVSSTSGQVDLIIGHLNIQGVAAGSETKDMPRGRDVYWPIALLNKKRPNVPRFAGHYHEAQTLADGTVIVGSLARLTFAEEGTSPRFLKVEI